MNVFEALQMFWRMWWRQEPVNVESRLDRSMKNLLSSDLAGAIKMSMDKLKHEPAYPGRPRLWDLADGPRKKKEVVEWAVKYYKEMGHAPEEISHWQLNYLIEYLVGVEKSAL